MRSERTACANLFDDFLVPRPVEHHDGDILDAFIGCARDDRQHFGNRHVDVERVAAFLHVIDYSRSVSEFRHVKRRNIAKRDFHSLFRARCRDTTDRIRRAFGNVGSAVDRINCNIELRRAGQPGAELFALENSGGVVLYAFADHDLAANVHEIEHSAHRVAGGGIGGFLVAAAKPAERVQRRGLSRADEIELNNAFDVVITDFWEAMHDGR